MTVGYLFPNFWLWVWIRVIIKSFAYFENAELKLKKNKIWGMYLSINKAL